jgi:hypothetical protein
MNWLDMTRMMTDQEYLESHQLNMSHMMYYLLRFITRTTAFHRPQTPIINMSSNDDDDDHGNVKEACAVRRLMCMDL